MAVPLESGPGATKMDLPTAVPPKSAKARPIDALWCAGCKGFFSPFLESYITDPTALLPDGTRAVFHGGCYAASLAASVATTAKAPNRPSVMKAFDNLHVYQVTTEDLPRKSGSERS